MNRYLQDILDQPETLRKVLDYSTGEGRGEIEAAAKAVKAADRIVLTSMGSAIFSCMPMYYALQKLHPNAHLVETAELLVEAPFFDDTLYIIMSRSGESGEIARFAKQIRQNNGKLLAVTMTPDSTLAKNADIVVNDVATFDGLICTKAFTSMSMLGLMIVSELAGELNDELAGKLCEHFTWMEENKGAMLKQMTSIKVLGEANIVYFLGHGVSTTLAKSGALYLAEGAWTPGVQESIDMFHHGPIEVVDKDFVGFWIDLEPNDRTRELYAEINSKEGTIITVSPDSNTYPDWFVLPSGELPVEYRVLSAAMVIQMATYHASTARGNEPGEMRYLNWLVK